MRSHATLLPALLIAGFSCITAAWVFANPAGYTPDEPAHHIKALGVAQWQLRGVPARYPEGPGFGPDQLTWINRTARAFVVPRGLSSAGLTCALFQPNVTARCAAGYKSSNQREFERSYVGTYEPFLYLLPGLAATAGHDATSSVIRGRVVSAFTALVLLAVAILVLQTPNDPTWIVGLLASVTPMVLFLSSGLSPSGPEIAASICFVAVLLRLTRGDPVPNLAWGSAAVSGSVLVLSRSLGIFFLTLYALLFLGLAGFRNAPKIISSGRFAALAAAGVVGAALMLEIVWQVTVQPHPPLPQHVPSALLSTLAEVPEAVRQDVGIFGWADVPMPPLSYSLWQGMVVGIVALGLVVAPTRHRLLLVGTLIFAVAGTLVVGIAVSRATHFPLYGRYVLPLWVVLPLVAGEIYRRHRSVLSRLAPRRLPLYVAVVAGSLHLIGWWQNERRYAVGAHGPVFFPAHAEWTPPLGWTLWILVVSLGTASILAAGAIASGETLTARQNEQS